MPIPTHTPSESSITRRVRFVVAAASTINAAMGAKNGVGGPITSCATYQETPAATDDWVSVTQDAASVARLVRGGVVRSPYSTGWTPAIVSLRRAGAGPFGGGGGGGRGVGGRGR